MKKFILAAILAAFAFAGDYELVGSVNTSFRIFGKDDRIEVIAVKDPKIDGVTCYVSYAKKAVPKRSSAWRRTAPKPLCRACRQRLKSSLKRS